MHYKKNCYVLFKLYKCYKMDNYNYFNNKLFSGSESSAHIF